jgi:hypothetical protein
MMEKKTRGKASILAIIHVGGLRNVPSALCAYVDIYRPAVNKKFKVCGPRNTFSELTDQNDISLRVCESRNILSKLANLRSW